MAMTPTIVFLAAGMSTRYGRLKQLEPVGPRGEALLDYAAFDAWRAGFARAVLIIREELEESFRSHIGPRWPEKLEVVFHHQRLDDLPGIDPPTEADPALKAAVERRRKPWGTAHALLTTRELLTEPFVLLNADDFYGPSAFSQGMALMGRELRRSPGDAPGFGLVAYTLEDTLTRHGGVTRGICSVDRKGWLEGIEEAFEVERAGTSITGRTLTGEGMLLSGQEPTSTNFWILTPEIFSLLERGFKDFLAKVASPPVEGGRGGDAPEPEFLLPMEVNRLLAGGEAR
ncbi:MAG: hypothetical protein ACWGSQ_05405, partial [Longimicrobiales bacterium]